MSKWKSGTLLCVKRDPNYSFFYGVDNKCAKNSSQEVGYKLCGAGDK